MASILGDWKDMMMQGKTGYPSNGFLVLLLLVGVSVASCKNTDGDTSTQGSLKVPDPSFWPDANSIADAERASFAVPVQQYRYATYNSGNLSEPDADGQRAYSPDRHCSVLLLAGSKEDRDGKTMKGWMRVQARSETGSPSCQPSIDYCRIDEKGIYWGQMVVSQTELDIIHSRLINQQLKGDFVATCITEKGTTGLPGDVRTEVRFTGWRQLNPR